MSKLERRKQVKAKLSLIDEADMNFRSSQLSQNLLQLLSDLHVIQENTIIGAFAPFDREPNWHCEWPKAFEKLTAYPAFDGSDVGMCFKKAAWTELVEKTDFGSKIRGPGDEAQVVYPGLLLVPGLAMSSKGERLGRGKGFYDRYMERFRGIKIGVCFDLQIDESLPVEPHDVLLDFIVTDLRIINCKLS